MNDIDQVIAFYRARLAEEEQGARAATPGPWRHDPNKHWRKPGTSWFEEAVFAGPAGADATCVAGTGETGDSQSMVDARYIARHDPARILRQVASGRTLIRLYEGACEMVETLNGHGLEGSHYKVAAESYANAIRVEASIWDDHADWDPGWRTGWKDEVLADPLPRPEA